MMHLAQYMSPLFLLILSLSWHQHPTEAIPKLAILSSKRALADTLRALTGRNEPVLVILEPDRLGGYRTSGDKKWMENYARKEKRRLDTLEGGDFGLNKRTLDSLEGAGFGLNKRRLDSLEGGFELKKRRLDNLEGNGLTGLRKRGLDSLEGTGFGGLNKRRLDSLEGAGLTGLKRALRSLNRYGIVGYKLEAKRTLDKLEGKGLGEVL